MKLFDIPDIKILWSTSSRFLKQFQEGRITKFNDYGKQPACYKDISFWVNNPKTFSENEFYELAQNISGDLIESIACIDTYEDKNKQRLGKCFRIAYCHRDRVLTNIEINEFYTDLRQRLSTTLNVNLR